MGEHVHVEPDPDHDLAEEVGRTALVDEALGLRDQVRICYLEGRLVWDADEPKGRTVRKRQVIVPFRISTPMDADTITGSGVVISDLARQLHRMVALDWPDPPEDRD